MKCKHCNRDISKAGPLVMHERKCATRSPAQRNLGSPRVAAEPADILMARVAQLESTLEVLGKHLPSSPNGLLLTSKNAKSYLTQFIMNLERTLEWARGMLKLVDGQEVKDFMKSRGFEKEEI